MFSPGSSSAVRFAGSQALVIAATAWEAITKTGPRESLACFLPGEAACPAVCADDCGCIKVKRLEEFVQVDTNENPNDDSNDQIFVMDIELAID